MKAAITQLKDKLFTEIHTKNLVYNTCWEDPRIDRKLLDFNTDSEVVMITSAGCNALDYLLENPNAIHCVDVNPRQNALLGLKIALFRHGNYEELHQFFGFGKHPNAKQHYQEHLRQYLPKYAAEYWDKSIVFFMPKSEKKSFYFRGTAGQFAWMFNKYLNTSPNTRKAIEALLAAKSLEEQTAAYNKVEPKILNKLVKWIMNRHITMSMLGVPRPQQDLIKSGFPGGMAGYLSHNIRHVFTELPIQDNYFWYLYLNGKYEKDRCPEYLKEDNFSALAERIDNVKLHTTTVARFLENNPGKYSHFIMLDHQDWLASHDPEALAEEWKLILANSKPGTKILLRSAALKIDFIPDFVKDKVTFQDDTTDKFHQQDRVGTYGCTLLAVVK